MLDETTRDHAALKLALKMARASEPGRKTQLDSKLEDEPWEDVARFAAYCEQGRTLRLKPWEVCPMEVNEDAQYDAADDLGGRRKAQMLLRQMLALGISRYHPDPVRAIEAAKKKTGT